MEKFQREMDHYRAHLSNVSGATSLYEEELKKLNEVNPDGNLLMKAALWGTEEDIRYLLRIKGVAVNETNSTKETAADILWKKERYEGLILVLQKDSHFPAGFKVAKVNQARPFGKELVEFVKGRNELHAQIEKGDLDFIKNYTEKNVASVYYGEDNISALSRALDHDKKEIYSHFASIRPKFSIPENDLKQIRPSQVLQKAHVLKLAANTKFVDADDREHWEAVINMYLALEEYEEVRCLMEAIRSEDFEILFHITESTLRIDTVEAFGWTDANGRITIAARDLVTTDGQKDVHRVFAHEICHLVMILMYKNAFHPFPQNDEKRKSEFENICKACYEKVSSLDHLIQRLFNKSDWIEELIVRIPEVVAVYGKEKSAHIFEKQVPSLLKYYKDYVIPDCKEFGKLCYYSDPLKEIKNIYKVHLGIRESDLVCSPFQQIENYEDYLTPWETDGKKIFLLRTTSPKLCATHIFHQFRRSHPLHTEKIFLAFSLEHYYEGNNKQIITKALKSQEFKRLILLVSERCHDLIKNFFQDVYFGSRGEKKVILVVPDVLCQQEWKAVKCLTYHWCNLTEEFQDELMRKNVLLQGRGTTLGKLLKNVEITYKLLREILEQQNLSVGEDWSCLGNKEKLELYIERTFVQHKFEKANFSMQELPHYRLFITGLAKGEVEKRTRKDWIQGIKPGDDIQCDSYIFIPEHEEEVTELFRGISSSFQRGNDHVPVFWLHYEDGDFLVREFKDCDEMSPRSTSCSQISDLEDKYSVKNQFDEKKIIQETKEKRVVLVADDPGTGKSTSARSMMDKIKEQNTENFIWKVHFEDLLKESHHDFVKGSKSSIRTIMRVCKIRTRFEEMIFPSLLGQHRRVILFLDGYDEINQDLRSKALQILKSLKDETKIQLWVLTRKDERLPLEVKMNAVSFSLAQFSEEDQLNYLNRFWKYEIGQASLREGFVLKLNEMVKNVEKYSKECSSLHLGMKEVVKLVETEKQCVKEKIHALDFHNYSKKAIDIVWKEVLTVQSVPPLWLWMMAIIITEKNLQMPVRQDVFKFYLDFSKIKVDLFLKEKCELKLEKKCQIRLYNCAKKRIVENLLAFSDELFGSLLFKDGQVKESDLEELVDVGLVKKVGRGYRFLHKTFGDFFFTQAITRSHEVEKEIKVDTCFLEKLLCPMYHEYLGVRNFLYCLIKRRKNRVAIFPKYLLDELQLSRAFLRCCPFAHTLTSKEIVLWRQVIQDCDDQLDVNESDVLIKKIDEKLIMHEDPELFLDQVLSLALRTFGEKWSHKLSDKLQIEASCALSLRSEKNDQISFN